MAVPGQVKRHLLSLSDSAPGELLTQDNAAVVVVFSCVASLLLVLVLIICACLKKEESNKNGITLKQVTPKPDRRSATSADGAEKGEGDVDVPVQDTCNNAASPQSITPPAAATVQTNADHDAKLSAEKRALPQIPLTSQSEEIDEDDNYDIIPISMIPSAATNKKTTPVSSTVTPAQEGGGDNNSELYSEVTNVESDGKKERKKSDPPYSRIKDKKEQGDPPYAKMKSPTATNSSPYVEVDNVGDPSYAQVTERPESGILPGAEAGHGAAAPPIPDKRFSGEENAMPPPAVVGGAKPASPDLPPRNLLGGADINGGSGPADGISPTAAAATENGCRVTPAEQPVAKREPPYSEVTARESIASIRHREEEERAHRLANPDVLYETVNYEQINNFRGNVAQQGRQLDDQNNGQSAVISSDLYAEITTRSGENSNRSSTYAHVPDLRNTHAPTPPPVESLKHLSLHGNSIDPEDSMVDPGYSKINKRTTIHRSTMESAETDEDFSLMYAVVDKSHKRSMSDGGARMSGTSEDVSHLYAQIDKSTKKSPSAAAASVPSHHEYEGTGARPKIRTNAHVLSGVKNSGEKKQKKFSTSSEFIDPAYDTVKDIPENYQTINIDPGYERVRNRGVKVQDDNGNPAGGDRVSEFDPNYDQVNVDEIMQSLPNNNADHAQIRPVLQNTSQRIDDDPWLKREPLYQEIDESVHEREEKKKRNQFGTLL